MAVDQFPAKLALALKVLSISRGRLAAEVGVDKSVVGRWVNGANAPTEHNLSNITATVAGRRPGFSNLDWEGDLAGFGQKLGLAEPTAGLMSGWLPAQVVGEALQATAARGGAYEGFWRSTRPSNEAPGTFIHDRILIRKGTHGLLDFRLSVVDMHFQGVAFPTQTQIFSLCADPATGVFIFTILNAVFRNRADVMDGLTLTVQRLGGGGRAVAAAVLLERTGLLGDDPEADDARHAAATPKDPRAPPGSVPPEIVAHLCRDVGPAALAAGGDFLLNMAFSQSLSRGPDPSKGFPA